MKLDNNNIFQIIIIDIVDIILFIVIYTLDNL